MDYPYRVEQNEESEYSFQNVEGVATAAEDQTAYCTAYCVYYHLHSSQDFLNGSMLRVTPERGACDVHMNASYCKVISLSKSSL